MKTITPEQLKTQGYTEDPEGRRRFDRPYKLPNGVLVLVFCGSLVGVAIEKLPILLALWIASGSFLTLFVVQVLVYRSTPRSRFTGKPLTKYKNAKPARDVLTELIYACEDSKTFFRRVWWLDLPN
jgi:hypothetical protein